jgi:hypothetical protein
MEQKDIDIYEILKDVEYGTELYTPMCGKVVLTCLTSSNEMIRTDKYTRIYRFDKNGRWEKEGEVMLFPSAEMRDWSKFFKKGDVLVSNDSDSHIIFKGFSKNDYTTFEGRHWISVSKKRYISCLNMRNVQDYHLEDNKDAAQTYINTIEKRLGGKLNLETLEIEKTQPEFKDGDIVMSDSGTIVLVRGISLTRKIYYHAYMCDEDIYINQVEGEFFSRISRIKRFATDSEKQQLFDALAKEGKRWDSEKKQIVDLKPAFEIGKLYVFNEDDEDGELTIIGKLIAKNESEDTLTFGNQYEIETEKFVTDQAFDLRISVNKELREATESEVELFNKHYAIWKKEKEARKQPVFKPFDKVLVRCGKKFKWLPAFFVRDRGDDFAARYNVLPLHSGKAADFTSCIPFEGHENFAFTDYDFVDLPF